MLETETTITFNRAESDAILGTCDPKWHRKMAKMKIEPYRKDGAWASYKLPKKLVSVRAPRVLSEAVRASLVARGKARFGART